MPNQLQQLQQQVLQHIDDDPQRQPLGGIGVFHCHSVQKLREIPIYHPSIVLVLSGNKQIILNEQEQAIPAGNILLLPAEFSLWMENQPDTHQQVFLSLAMCFSPQVLDSFHKLYSQKVTPSNSKIIWQAEVPDDVLLAIQQWFQWCQQHPIDDAITAHRQLEILLLLAQAGLVNNLLYAKHPQWKTRVAQIINMNLAHAWKTKEITERLNVSESTLRRHLQNESSSFRKILEENRLVAGLSLLQETHWTIQQIAQMVGYQSQSRFCDRFKQRFGMTPSALKKTRQKQIS